MTILLEFIYLLSLFIIQKIIFCRFQYILVDLGWPRCSHGLVQAEGLVGQRHLGGIQALVWPQWHGQQPAKHQESYWNKTEDRTLNCLTIFTQLTEIKTSIGNKKNCVKIRLKYLERLHIILKNRYRFYN